MSDEATRDEAVKVYGYRWVVLGVFMGVNVACQILWICYSPVMHTASVHFGVSDNAIGWLGMVFMVVYLPLALPAAWILDTWGLRVGIGLGAVLLGVFGILRGLFAVSYLATMLFTIGIAASQPFFLGAFAKLAARWFPLKERATAVGLCAVAAFLGIVLGAAFSPVAVKALGFHGMQLGAGALALGSAVVFLVLFREAPPTPPGAAGEDERALMFDGLKLILKSRDFWLLTIALFVGGGIFNGLSIWVEAIVRPRGISQGEAGTLAAAMMIGGIVGAIVLPLVSDKLRRRKAVLFVSAGISVVPLAGLLWAGRFSTLLTCFALVGFFLTGLAPVAYQYGAEITHPVPEGTSNGLYALAGQVAVVFVYAMGWVNTVFHSFLPAIAGAAVLMGICAVLLAFVRESPQMRAPGVPAAR